MEANSLEKFNVEGSTDRNLSFEKDSLALKALQDGQVDFHDKRVEF